MRGGTAQPAIFVSAVAQQDNLGDLVLRRAAIRTIVTAGAVPHVLVVGMSPSFVAALELPDEATTYSTNRSWTRALLMPPRGVTHHLMFSPGPQRLACSPYAIAHAAASLSLAWATRRCGGAVIKIGRSLSGRSWLLHRLELRLHELCAVYTVRDQRSADLLAPIIAEIAPDIALLDPRLLPVEDQTARDVVALSFRGDREVDIDTLHTVVTYARSVSMNPMLITQVERDNTFHVLLGERLGCDVVCWPPGRDHQEQLEEVLKWYRRSALVVSNRLHSLIFGLAMGATPLGLIEQDDQKVSGAMGVFGLAERMHRGPGPLSVENLAPADLRAVIDRGQDRLQVVATSIRDAVSPYVSAADAGAATTHSSTIE